MDGAGRLAGGLGASRDACGRVGSTRAACTVDKVLARCELLTDFAARAAAVGTSNPVESCWRSVKTFSNRPRVTLLPRNGACDFCLDKTIHEDY